MEKEILTAIKEDRLYDFIANNYHRIDKEISKDLLLELVYMIYFDYEYSYEGNTKVINNHIIGALKENRDWEE